MPRRLTAAEIRALHEARSKKLSPKRRTEIARAAALARAASLSPERRSEIASIAGVAGANKRWGRKSDRRTQRTRG